MLNPYLVKLFSNGLSESMINKFRIRRSDTRSGLIIDNEGFHYWKEELICYLGPCRELIFPRPNLEIIERKAKQLIKESERCFNKYKDEKQESIRYFEEIMLKYDRDKGKFYFTMSIWTY